MKMLHLMAGSAVMSGVLIFAAAKVDAQQRPVAGGARINFPSHGHHFSWEGKHGFHGGFHGGFGNVWVVEREVPVIVEVPVAPPPVTPPLPPHQGEGEKRKPYVIGSTYASLPGGCMKMIEEGVSYFYCSGEWYREVRAGRDPLYRAVARKL